MVTGSHVPTERPRGMINRVVAVLTTFVLIGLSGCAIKPIPLTTDEVRSRAQEGRVVLTKQLGDNNGYLMQRLDVNNLSNGLYFITMQSGGIRLTEKFEKK